MFPWRWPYLLVAPLTVFALMAARASNGSGREVRYIVRPGDTLWRLAAERYGGDPRRGVWEISERNGLESAVLRPGTVLFLPLGGGDA
jgi:hypothetical protein